MEFVEETQICQNCYQPMARSDSAWCLRCVKKTAESAGVQEVYLNVKVSSSAASEVLLDPRQTMMHKFTGKPLILLTHLSLRQSVERMLSEHKLAFCDTIGIGAKKASLYDLVPVNLYLMLPKDPSRDINTKAAAGLWNSRVSQLPILKLTSRAVERTLTVRLVKHHTAATG